MDNRVYNNDQATAIMIYSSFENIPSDECPKFDKTEIQDNELLNVVSQIIAQKHKW